MILILKDVSARVCAVVHNGNVFQLPRPVHQKCKIFFRRRPPTSSKSTVTVKNDQ